MLFVKAIFVFLLKFNWFLSAVNFDHESRMATKSFLLSFRCAERAGYLRQVDRLGDKTGKQACVSGIKLQLSVKPPSWPSWSSWLHFQLMML
jgi:hypothetical protein